VTRAALAALLAAAIGCLPLAGCFNDRGDPPPPVRKVGLRLDQFPDIGFPGGWRPLAGEDHLAIAIASGTVRRLQFAMQAPPARSDLQPDDAMKRYVAGVLPEDGWVRTNGDQPGDTTQLWAKNGEILEVRATREDSLAVLRYRLLPPAAPAP
jgi:hypothetical protein